MSQDRSDFASTFGRLRRVDALGRVVLPADLRHALGIREGDELEIGVDEGNLVLTKAEPSCLFCGTGNELRELSGKHACGVCATALNDLDAG